MQLDVIYTDKAKAFDTDQRGIILRRLIAFHRIHTSLWDHIHVTERNQQKGGAIPKKSVNSGVPQVSELGPFSFIIFINYSMNPLEKSYGALIADNYSS